MQAGKRVLATDFGIWLAFKELHKLSDAMFLSEDHWSGLANYLLLYDQIVIPTGNLQVLPVLRLMLGDDVFSELISSRVIVLARYDQWFAYAGGGAGLSFFQIHPATKRSDGGKNLGMAHFLPLDQAVEVVIRDTRPTLPEADSRRLASLLLERVVPLDFPRSELERLVKETHADIEGSPYLRDLLMLKTKDLKNLGLPADKLKIFNPHLPPEPTESKRIRSVLRVAFENFLLHVGSATSCSDITGDSSTFNLLRAKGQRFGVPLEGAKAFAQIQQVAGVPDLGMGFAKKLIGPRDILKLRDSQAGVEFRRWLAEGAAQESADQTLARFIEASGHPAWIDRLPLKALRFATTTAWGALEPLTGSIASFADNFMLRKLFPGKSPMLFMKQAKVLMDASKPEFPKVSGRDRNKDCFCGSGRKFKNCHGRA